MVLQILTCSSLFEDLSPRCHEGKGKNKQYWPGIGPSPPLSLSPMPMPLNQWLLSTGEKRRQKAWHSLKEPDTRWAPKFGSFCPPKNLLHMPSSSLPPHAWPWRCPSSPIIHFSDPSSLTMQWMAQSYPLAASIFYSQERAIDQLFLLLLPP